MAKLSEFEVDFLSLLKEAVTTLEHVSKTEGVLPQILVGIVVIGICAWLALHVIGKLADLVVSLVENLQKLGFRFFSAHEKKMSMRRRQQFCAVLRSDLDSISKSENWNDQWFTDLEAEVEAEGSYYANSIARLTRQRSTGTRRVPSLMQAIQSSTERCMLLVGEPGSGKSVALRHLAREIADAGSKSKASKARVPLYINLKELPACESGVPNADFIQQFVLEHIRRGDSDTAAYVRDHWENFKEQGTWLFLFDSFDEIPAVLHAPNGSQSIFRHSEALRQFMDGMGACRGVLASREYKGPEALPWKKLRVLPLSRQRQDELIDNTYLGSREKNLVRQHLATVETPIFGNPLFISLLCRYVGDTGTTPSNDHDLLVRHLSRLAQRDPEFMKKKYELDSVQLLEGATTLAVLFAELPELSLAPRYDELDTALQKRSWTLPAPLEKLLSALIDVKIGRSDVKEAIQGDRRFTFSHRRYQETLFVEYLASHPEHLTTRELLLDSRWREFTVTLIQSQAEEYIVRFISEAINLLFELPQRKSLISPSFLEKLEAMQLGEIGYYKWENDYLLHLLGLLNEGFSRRTELVTQGLRHAVASKLTERWQEGDLHDRLLIVRHGCLLPTLEFQRYLEWAIDSKIDLFRQASFGNASFLGLLPTELESWVRKRYADEVLVADSKVELFKLDALGSRLPPGVGAATIFRRCTALRTVLKQSFIMRSVIKYMTLVISAMNFILPIQVFSRENLQTSNGKASMLVLITGYLAALSFTVTQTAVKTEVPIWSFVGCIGINVLSVIFFFRLLMRAESKMLTPTHLLHCIRSIGAKGMDIISVLIAVIIASIFFGGIAWLIVKLISMGEWGIFAASAIPFAPFVIALVSKLRASRRAGGRMPATLNDGSLLGWAEVRQADSADELLYWLKKSPRILLDPEISRQILAYCSRRFQRHNDKKNRLMPKMEILGGFLLGYSIRE